MSLRLMSAVVSTNTNSQNKPQDSDKLVKQLLECVQECQKRYGGKTELATEFDSCVIALCLTLESVFSHGLRVKPQEIQQSSALKQVSDIVANSLHIGTDKPSFWPFINKHLTKHEQERYAVLKHVWTDTGRSRAWLRSALNERSLERYFHTVLSNEAILHKHYEDWALLCDHDKNSMLPNMAAGLASILFAISIDKPELNSCTTLSSDALRTRPEPIIEAPLPADQNKDRTKGKKKKKVARQFISFDEDDSMLSTSVPSSSSSISSESNSINSETQSSKCTAKNSQLSQITEETKKVDVKPTMDEDKSQTASSSDSKKIIRKLSMENSGAREKFTNEVPGTLTPVSHAEIGELTPVSVELNRNYDTSNVSDDTVEVPTDISAVLTAVEAKNKEEINKVREKLESVVKENECLKEQVSKYISAIKMLKGDDGEFSIDNMNLERQPDYKSEAKIFEKKLVQVAEMHAELMDFNVMLQQSICKKDTLLERLKAELEILRGPMPTDDVNAEVGSVNVWIPSAFLTGSGSNSHHVYQIFLRAGNDEWNIYRRYAQFYVLHSDLKKLDPAVATFDFPPKKSIGKKDSALVEDRRKRLQTYLRRILAHWPELSQCNSRFLLEQQLAFFKDVKEEIKNKKGIFSSRRSTSSDNHYTGL